MVTHKIGSSSQRGEIVGKNVKEMPGPGNYTIYEEEG